MILTKAFSEIRIILRLLGGREDTLFLACGFGDFCLTSLNDLSRNRTLGLLIGKGFFNSDYKSNSVILVKCKTQRNRFINLSNLYKKITRVHSCDYVNLYFTNALNLLFRPQYTFRMSWYPCNK